tara:strand:- start:57 stop:251 length:195 start_codon:yes stop_codon:yes gene_type:complete
MDLKKNKFLKFRGTMSESEVDAVNSLVPNTRTENFKKGFVDSVTGAVSQRELNFLKKMLPKGVK